VIFDRDHDVFQTCFKVVGNGGQNSKVLPPRNSTEPDYISVDVNDLLSGGGGRSSEMT